MKIITIDQIKRLEEISIAIERAKSDGKSSKLIDDLLSSELRKSYSLIEDQTSKLDSGFCSYKSTNSCTQQ